MLIGGANECDVLKEEKITPEYWWDGTCTAAQRGVGNVCPDIITSKAQCSTRVERRLRNTWSSFVLSPLHPHRLENHTAPIRPTFFCITQSKFGAWSPCRNSLSPPGRTLALSLLISLFCISPLSVSCFGYLCITSQPGNVKFCCRTALTPPTSPLPPR